MLAQKKLQMVWGYSPHQLVFGRNPEIPILTGYMSPSMTEEILEETLREILEYAHKAREIYIQQEADRKIKRALRHEIRKQVQEINIREKLYYKKDVEDKWRGPLKVMGKEAKTVVVKQGTRKRCERN